MPNIFGTAETDTTIDETVGIYEAKPTAKLFPAKLLNPERYENEVPYRKEASNGEDFAIQRDEDALEYSKAGDIAEMLNLAHSGNGSFAYCSGLMSGLKMNKELNNSTVEEISYRLSWK
ncbi:MAG: hypothetical protein ACOCQG_00595 [Candidatus Nanoarchaeia archaeon]